MAGESLLGLSGPLGAVGPVRRVAAEGWLPPDFHVFSAYTGNPSAVAGPYRADARSGYGTGRGYGDPDHARLLAVSEALERYAGLVAARRGLTRATADELGPDALDLDRVARCSADEIRRSGGLVRRANRTESLDWVTGVDLLTGQDRLVPSVMVHLRPPVAPVESFWLPISTGCAVHRTYESAVLGALLELVERDAIAMTWLRRRRLPVLAGECLDDVARELIGWAAERGIVTHLFDATTDVGIPVVYCLQLADAAPAAAQLIGCSCGFDVRRATRHAIMETMAVRYGVYQQPVPRRYADYRSITDSAAAMGRPARRSAFGFLLDDLSVRPVSAPLPQATSSSGQLRVVLDRLAGLGMSVTAVDLTTTELAGAGYVAVRVVVPELQPMGGRPLVQYRDHPRLSADHPQLGPLPEALNPYPQPMA